MSGPTKGNFTWISVYLEIGSSNAQFKKCEEAFADYFCYHPADGKSFMQELKIFIANFHKKKIISHG